LAVDSQLELPAGSADQDQRLRELILESSQLAEAGDWGERALVVNEALARALPNAVGVRLRLAGCLEEAGDRAGAVREFDAVAVLESSDKDRAFAERRSKELRGAMRAALETRFTVARQTAISLRDSGELEQALHWHRRAYVLAGSANEKAGALAAAASTFRNLRKFREAERLARRAVSLVPDPSVNHFAQAALIAALVDVGQLREACERAEQTLRHHPSDLAVNRAAGRAFYAMARATSDESMRLRAAECFRGTS
jgi:tetratricopeptide (TPR) repeat protein